METISYLVNKQRNYFHSGVTREYAFRKKQLKQLRKMLKKNETRIYQALKHDLRKSKHETLTTELGILYTEIDMALKHLKDWMKPEKVPTPLTHKGTKNIVLKEPYGVTLIIAPWNYPLQLALAPAIGALAAGNTVIVKPSEFAWSTSNLLQNMISTYFSHAYMAVVEGEKDVSQALLKESFDYIFFTGSSRVGKEVMKQASNHLTPVTLELGGKSPAIVDQDANIRLAAKRIAWGKFTNAGQTCVAPDYVYVHHKVKQTFVQMLKKYIKQLYGKRPLKNKDYVRIIHQAHFKRLCGFLGNGSIVHGGQVDHDKCLIEPTILDDVSWGVPIMQEEIFGPILPVLPFWKLEDVVSEMSYKEKPLALYYFGSRKKNKKYITTSIPFGGGCVNDTLYHLANPHLPFGGIGHSGMGAYHGKYSFDTFSHYKGILNQTTIFDIPLRYPGGKMRQSVVKRLMS